MAYFVTIFIAFLLAIVEVSFLPHFKLFNIVPFITLAFLSGLAVKYRGIFHILLAFAVGIFFSSISSVYIWVFPVIFTLTMIVGRYFFYREAGYNTFQLFNILFLSSTFILYLLNSGQFLISQTESWLKVAYIFLIAIIVNFIVGSLIYKAFDKFYDWVNKMLEEKYR